MGLRRAIHLLRGMGYSADRGDPSVLVERYGVLGEDCWDYQVRRNRRRAAREGGLTR